MNKKLMISNAIMWAAAILSGALVGAPVYYTIILLPTLAFFSLESIRKSQKS